MKFDWRYNAPVSPIFRVLAFFLGIFLVAGSLVVLIEFNSSFRLGVSSFILGVASLVIAFRGKLFSKDFFKT